MTEIISPAAVVGFWKDAGPDKWFRKDEAFDAEIIERFGRLHHGAARAELSGWAATPEGALALLILLDQFPRNMFRGSAHAFATDALALSIARRAVAAGFDQRVDAGLRYFFYLPFEHSERAEDQARCVDLSKAYHDAVGAQQIYDYACLHRDIIARFGRFPHRNGVLGRETTPEEQAFLDEGGFAG